ncbi:iron-containing redox enzyme family protein [Dermatobacter hominis]|uniref:iron-containing redox enzyme family protein n=1 Tax=Dermatobacter hominis TaxID=2884263 RepID=UPI001D10B895|nr:iron-containing redox enzyme family protein [Dermatobacter hominis]UDY37462.1 iron-containing redox enzyme family protein [Dermatobacter hominis]
MTPGQTLPIPRGRLSSSLVEHLRTGEVRIPSTSPADVLGDEDAQLALHVVYELSYRGYAGVDERMERDDEVLRVRHRLEDAMEAQLRSEVGLVPRDAVALLERLSAPSDGPSLSRYLLERSDLGMMREFAIHRSAYQLKEADPHTWAMPRLDGRAKAALVEIQSDEYGRGVPGAAHAELWAETMDELGLDPTYGRYVDRLPATTLATGNLISLLGLQRRLTPALLGHLALFEMTSTGPMARYSAALAAVGVSERGRRFFDVHVEADAYHEVLARTDLVGGYLERHPEGGREVAFGALALDLVERRFAGHLLDSFEEGSSSLRPAPAEAVAA